MEPGTARLGRYRQALGCFCFRAFSFAAWPLSLSGGGLAWFLCVPLALGGLAFVALLLCHAASRRLITTAAFLRLETYALAAIAFYCMPVPHGLCAPYSFSFAFRVCARTRQCCWFLRHSSLFCCAWVSGSPGGPFCCTDNGWPLSVGLRCRPCCADDVAGRCALDLSACRVAGLVYAHLLVAIVQCTDCSPCIYF